MAGGGPLRTAQAVARAVGFALLALPLGMVALADGRSDRIGLLAVLTIVVLAWAYTAAGWFTAIDSSIPGVRWAIERRTVRAGLVIVGIGGIVSHWFDLTTAARMIAVSGVGVEANPVGRFLVDAAGGWGLVAGKVALAAIVVLAVTTLWRSRTRQADALALGITAAFLAAGMLGAWSNARVLAVVLSG